MFDFINHYRLSVAEAASNSNYGEAIVHAIIFPIFYVSARLTDLLYKSPILGLLTKGINNRLGNKEDTADEGGYVIDENGRLHLGNTVPRYTNIDEDVLSEALERSIHRAHQTGQTVNLCDIIEEIKAERR